VRGNAALKHGGELRFRIAAASAPSLALIRTAGPPRMRKKCPLSATALRRVSPRPESLEFPGCADGRTAGGSFAKQLVFPQRTSALITEAKRNCNELAGRLLGW